MGLLSTASCFSPVRLVLILFLPLGFEFFEASAKDNINVKQVFERLVDVICEKMNESLDASPGAANSNHKNTTLNEVPPAQSSSCSC